MWSVRTIVVFAFVVVACGSRGDAPRSKPYPPGSGRPVAAATPCPTTRPPGTANSATGGACKKDDDCTTGKNGRCLTAGGRMMMNQCTYDACFTDADCKTGGPCECQSWGNACLSGNCRTDADCGANGACGRSNAMACRGPGQASYYCRTAADTCESYDDCKNGTACVYSLELGHWACVAYPQCPVG
jgi:hypothetical protein